MASDTSFPVSRSNTNPTRAAGAALFVVALLVAGCRSAALPSRLIVTVVDERCGWTLPGVRVVATALHREDKEQTTGSDGTATFALGTGEWRLTATLQGAPVAEARIHITDRAERLTVPLRLVGKDTLVVMPHGPCTGT